MKAVIFDLDGTLVASAPGIRRATDDVLLHFGRRALCDGEVEAFVGDGVEALLQRSFSATGDVPAVLPVDQWCAAYARHAIPETFPFPGIVEMLDHLHAQGFVLGLCTNKPQAETEALLAALNLHSFVSVIGGDVLPVRKPDPSHVHAVREAMGVDTAWFVGDSPVDAEASARAGLPFVLVDWGYSRVPRASLPCFARVATVEALLQVLLTGETGTKSE